MRASINLGNPILAHSSADGAAGGVSVDLARAFARLSGVELELVVFDTAGKSVEAVTAERADFGFFAIDPLRGAAIAFSAPYVLIEGFYLVRDGSPLRANADVDAAGNRVVVGAGSAYDLFLTRQLKQAQILRAPTSPRQQLEVDAAKEGALRLLEQRFMLIEQAKVVPKSRGPEAAAFLAKFVEEIKVSGFVADALQRHRIRGASVAPAASAG